MIECIGSILSGYSVFYIGCSISCSIIGVCFSILIDTSCIDGSGSEETSEGVIGVGAISILGDEVSGIIGDVFIPDSIRIRNDTCLSLENIMRIFGRSSICITEMIEREARVGICCNDFSRVSYCCIAVQSIIGVGLDSSIWMSEGCEVGINT